MEDHRKLADDPRIRAQTNFREECFDREERDEQEREYHRPSKATKSAAKRDTDDDQVLGPFQIRS